MAIHSLFTIVIKTCCLKHHQCLGGLMLLKRLKRAGSPRSGAKISATCEPRPCHGAAAGFSPISPLQINALHGSQGAESSGSMGESFRGPTCQEHRQCDKIPLNHSVQCHGQNKDRQGSEEIHENPKNYGRAVLKLQIIFESPLGFVN